MDFFVRMWAGPGTRAPRSGLCVLVLHESALPAGEGRIPGCLAGLTGGGVLGRAGPARPTDIPLSEWRASRCCAGWRGSVAFLRDLRRRYGRGQLRRTISSWSRIGASPIVRRRPIPACSCYRHSRLTTSAISARLRWSIGWERTLDTFDRLETHWGHFYNWYDTRTLYRSSPGMSRRWTAGTCSAVAGDSRPVCWKSSTSRCRHPAAIDGLADTASLVARIRGETCQEVLAHFDNPPSDLSQWKAWLQTFKQSGRGAGGRIEARMGPDGGASPSLNWLNCLIEQVESRQEELARLERTPCADEWIGRVRRLVARIEQQCAGDGFPAAVSPGAALVLDRHQSRSGAGSTALAMTSWLRKHA